MVLSRRGILGSTATCGALPPSSDLDMSTNDPQWSSRAAFLLASIGSAVGLGNIWRFPYIVGENGGGVFLLVYLACISLVGVPVLIGMLVIGKLGRKSPVDAVASLAERSGASRRWRWVGGLAVFLGFIAFSYFSVIASWVFFYLARTALGALSAVDVSASQQVHQEFLGNPALMVLLHALFAGMTVAIVARGLRKGIERAVKLMMPALFLFLLVLVLYSGVVGDFGHALRFLFAVDLSRMDGSAFLLALGQALFTLGVGGPGLMMYGAYVPREVSLPRAAIVIASADTVVAVLAGLAIFPIVFESGLTPGQGPGLVFVTLPVAFAKMPGGALFGTLFFLLVFAAALSTSISMLEPTVRFFEERRGWRRTPVAVGFGSVAWLLGLGSLFSFNIWEDFHPLGGMPMLGGRNIFGLLDFSLANLLMPTSALLISIFAGWIMGKRLEARTLGLNESTARRWLFLVRYAAPLAIVAVFWFQL